MKTFWAIASESIRIIFCSDVTLPTMYSISIVIPNFNGLNLLQENLPAVYEALETSNISDFEIIVADDASTDGSVEFLQNRYPDIVVIRNAKNQGFSGNINSGIRVATKDLVLALNNDVRLTPGYFIPQLPYFDKGDTFGVMGRIDSMDGTEQQHGANYPNCKFTKIASIGNYVLQDQTAPYTFFLSGANALMNREKFLLIGGFNELFNPYYREDVDLTLTAWQFGYTCYYENNAVCYHTNSATIVKEPDKKVKIIGIRNKIILHYLHLENFERYCFIAKTIVKTVGRLLIGDGIYLAAFRQFISLFDKLKKHRMWLNKNKQYRLKDVVKYRFDRLSNRN